MFVIYSLCLQETRFFYLWPETTLRNILDNSFHYHNAHRRRCQRSGYCLLRCCSGFSCLCTGRSLHGCCWGYNEILLKM